MAKIYAYDKELAKKKATELGKDLAKQTLEMSDSVLDELVAYLDSGSNDPFVPSAMTNNIMPVYSFENIGGTGLPADSENEDKEPGNTADGIKTEASVSKAPNTGDSSDMVIYLLLAAAALTAAAATGACSLKKTKNN